MPYNIKMVQISHEDEERLKYLLIRRAHLMELHKEYIDYIHSAMRRHVRFTAGYRAMVGRHLGYNWGVQFVTKHQNDLLFERTQLISEFKRCHKDPNVLLYNKKAILTNWDNWMVLHTSWAHHTWWAHTHERLVLENRVKIMKAVEISEKIMRDILNLEAEAREIVQYYLDEKDYQKWLKDLHYKQYYPTSFWQAFYVCWHHWRGLKTPFERKHLRLWERHQTLLKTQKSLLKKLNRSTHGDHQLAIRQEANSDFFERYNLWKDWYVGLYEKSLNDEHGRFFNVRKTIANPTWYRQILKDLKGLEGELGDYRFWLWVNREHMQKIQSRLTKARLNTQYYLQLLKENQIALIHNQARIITHQDQFFNENNYLFKDSRFKKKQGKRFSSIRKWHIKRWEFLDSVLKNLNLPNIRTLKIFPYEIEWGFPSKVELPFLASSPAYFHYYNGFGFSTQREHFFFISFFIPILFFPHIGFLLRVYNTEPEFRYGPWWKWRTPSQILLEWSFQSPLGILKELFKGGEHYKRWHRWGKHYTEDPKFPLKLWKYKYHKFDYKFEKKLEIFSDSYYLMPEGDLLNHPAVCDFSKDFATYYYHHTSDLNAQQTTPFSHPNSIQFNNIGGVFTPPKTNNSFSKHFKSHTTNYAFELDYRHDSDFKDYINVKSVSKNFNFNKYPYINSTTLDDNVALKDYLNELKVFTEFVDKGYYNLLLRHNNDELTLKLKYASLKLKKTSLKFHNPSYVINY